MRVSFQVVLFEGSNEIYFNYDRITSAQAKTVTGIENQAGTVGMRYPGFDDDGIIHDYFTVRFYRGDPPLVVDPPVVDPPVVDLPVVDPPDVETETTIFFPMVLQDSDSGFETHVCLLNNSAVEPLVGDLLAYSSSGEFIASMEQIVISELGRREYNLGEAFPQYRDEIAYLSFVSGFNTAVGYCNISEEGKGVAASYPAVMQPGSKRELYLPFLAFSGGWETRVAIVNVSDIPNKALITFNNGATGTLDLRAHGQTILNLAGDFTVNFNNETKFLNETTPLPTAVKIEFEEDASVGTAEVGMVGAALYNNGAMMGAVSLKSEASTLMTCPHLAMADGWWSSIALFNPNSEVPEDDDCQLEFTPYDADGVKLNVLAPIPFGNQQTIIKNVIDLVPSGSSWSDIVSDCTMFGIEFFGTGDGKQLATVGLSNDKALTGVFPQIYIDRVSRWSAIVILNPGAEKVEVALKAYDDNGHLEGEDRHEIMPFDRLIGGASQLFKTDISQATSIRFQADHEVIGLLLNGRSYESEDNDLFQLDALPSLLLETTGSYY